MVLATPMSSASASMLPVDVAPRYSGARMWNAFAQIGKLRSTDGTNDGYRWVPRSQVSELTRMFFGGTAYHRVIADFLDSRGLTLPYLTCANCHH